MSVQRELTSKERAALRALANTMDPILHIGKEGVGENLIKQGYDALEARELIKVQVMRNAPCDAKEACLALAQQLHAHPVQCIGMRFVLYRPARKNHREELPDVMPPL